MERFFGFDLGDAESAIARLYRDEQQIPEIVPVCDSDSFISACAVMPDGALVIAKTPAMPPRQATENCALKAVF